VDARHDDNGWLHAAEICGMPGTQVKAAMNVADLALVHTNVQQLALCSGHVWRWLEQTCCSTVLQQRVLAGVRFVTMCMRVCSSSSSPEASQRHDLSVATAL
jgi:hypothetical protein